MDGNTEPKFSRPSRLRASGPILILAVLFVIGSFLAWYFTWFGRGLSDSEITQYLNDQKHPRHVQHALLQIQQRIERGDTSARLWYPAIVALATNPETEFRLTAAWVMGFDNSSQDFHQALLTLLHDPEPIVRRNSALALVRFMDPSGHDEIVSILTPYTVGSPAAGVIDSTLREGSQVSRGTLLARIRKDDGTTMEVRSPLPGSIDRIAIQNGTRVSQTQAILVLNPDEESVWEALRALALIGGPGDLPQVDRMAQTSSSDRIKQQAALTAKTIQYGSTKKQ